MNNERLTEELLNDLLKNPKVENFINSNSLETPSLSENLQQMLDKYNIKKSEVINSCNLDHTHAYQIFQGTRMASRNKILQLSFAIGCSYKDTNRLLYSADLSTLYPKNRRDAIIIYCISNCCSLAKTNETLYQFQEDTLDD